LGELMSDPTLLKQFLAWGFALAELPNMNSEIEIEVCIPTDNPAARIDFGSDEFLGRITLWSDGSFFVEALRIEIEEYVVMRHGVAAACPNFDQEFEDMLHLFRTIR
jgi:hypothetical protein